MLNLKLRSGVERENPIKRKTKGERKSEKEAKKENYLRRENSYGAFERRMSLPEGARADSVKANFRNEVVEVTIPLAKEVGARKIPLEIESERTAEHEKK